MAMANMFKGSQQGTGTAAEGQDHRLEKKLLGLWEKAGTPAKDVEAGPVPRPSGGIGLCVTFLPVQDNQAEQMLRILLQALIRKRLTRQFLGLQIAVSKALPDNEAGSVVIARYFFEADSLRALERDPSVIKKEPLDSFVSTKQIVPLDTSTNTPEAT